MVALALQGWVHFRGWRKEGGGGGDGRLSAMLVELYNTY